jgi:dienelactone hydrolase
MRLSIVPAILTILFISSVRAEVQTKRIEYKIGEQTFVGTLAFDDATAEKRPGVIVVHEWWGRTSYADNRAKQLAKLGYVAFAVDMYGDGKTTEDPKQAGEWAGVLYKDPKIMIERFGAGLDTLKKQPQVDGDRLAAIGYCFGGSTVLNAARSGAPLLGVVSFHGGLKNPGVSVASPIKTKILICHGADDQFESKEEIDGFQKEMSDAKADLSFKVYPGAVHSFTNPDADKHNMKGVAYNESADKASWADMQAFLSKIFTQ